MTVNMNKESPEAISESKVNRKLVALGLACAFAAGAFIKGEVDKRQEKPKQESCLVTVTQVSDGTSFPVSGPSRACAPFLSILRGGEDSTPDEQDDQATDDQAAPCDPASASAGASQ